MSARPTSALTAAAWINRICRLEIHPCRIIGFAS